MILCIWKPSGRTGLTTIKVLRQDWSSPRKTRLTFETTEARNFFIAEITEKLTRLLLSYSTRTCFFSVEKLKHFICNSKNIEHFLFQNQFFKYLLMLNNKLCNLIILCDIFTIPTSIFNNPVIYFAKLMKHIETVEPK